MVSRFARIWISEYKYLNSNAIIHQICNTYLLFERTQGITIKNRSKFSAKYQTIMLVHDFHFVSRRTNSHSGNIINYIIMIPYLNSRCGFMLNHTRTHTDETLVRQTSGTQASFHVCTRTTEFCGSATRAGHVTSSSLPNRPRQMVRYAQAYVSECFIPTSTSIPLIFTSASQIRIRVQHLCGHVIFLVRNVL